MRWLRRRGGYVAPLVPPDSLSDRFPSQENRAAEEAIQNHGLQIQQFERDRELLQQAVNKLEEDLVVARRAQDSLDEQKQENVSCALICDPILADLVFIAPAQGDD